MKNLMVIFIVLFSAHSAWSMAFYTYSCNFSKVGNEWMLNLAYAHSYKTELGWNQSALVYKERTSDGVGEDIFEYGLCSSITSDAPDNLKLNIYWVEDGKNLSDLLPGCMFSGTFVNIRHESQQLVSNNSYLSSTYTYESWGSEQTHLHIVGVTPSRIEDGAEEGLCHEKLREISERDSRPF